jgi:basic amino acid/polyamine antiporter, APA family
MNVPKGKAEPEGRRISPRMLFAIIYATSISSVYFALGVVAHHAQGLTPLIFIFAGIFFQLTSMTYAEGASLHPQRGGSPTFARYAFNELVGFISGWSIVLDYILLIAVAALAVPSYLSVFWPSLGHGDARVIAAVVVIIGITLDTMRGTGAEGLRRQILFSAMDLIVQAALIIFGLILVFHGSHLTASVHLGSAPTIKELGFAIPIAVVAFTGIEAATSLAVDAKTSPTELRRLIATASAAVVVVYVGIAVVGIGVLPVHNGITGLGQHENAPVLNIAKALRPQGFADVFKYVVGITGALGLIAASGAGMLGVSRAGYSMATHRQIPSAVGRLSSRWGTPIIIIGVSALAAIGLVIPANLESLVDIYAFGALVTFTIAHVSVIVMRFREPALERDYRIPFSIPIGKASVPLPAVLGAIMSFAGWAILVVFHQGARYVGLGWLLVGVILYVIYRKASGRPILRRIVIPDRVLRQAAKEAAFGSILVPVFGNPTDTDLLQTAGRLAGDHQDDVEEEGATIEAIYVIPVPVTLSLDAPLPPAQIQAGREALKRAKILGEQYKGVEVATALVRSRRVGHGIVQEAKRRGVEAIVLAAELPGAGRPPKKGADFFGAVNRYVIDKAPCRVILTAPANDQQPAALAGTDKPTTGSGKPPPAAASDEADG